MTPEAGESLAPRASSGAQTLLDIGRRRPAAPWRDGDNIPWDDPDFSRRMLREHLAQHHDAASRRFSTIDAHVAWIHEHLGGRPAKILDLGCGPGLYTHRLARLGHSCTGIDFSPASIEHAASAARDDGIGCDHRLGDLRSADFGAGFDLVMLISGELNVFRPADAEQVLRKAGAALIQGGTLLLEVHPEAAVRDIGARGLRWYAAPFGVFSDQPHLCLQEHTWDAATETATIRYYVIDAASGTITAYAQTYQAYDRESYRTLLAQTGFASVEFFPSLTGAPDDTAAHFEVIRATP
ncbi:MAG: class I SAM-dependent methyltransferase [Dehalococcoidia bacterium]